MAGAASLESSRARVASMRYLSCFSDAQRAVTRSRERLPAVRRWSCDALMAQLYYVGMRMSCAVTIGRHYSAMGLRGVSPRAVTWGQRFGTASTRSWVTQHQQRAAHQPSERWSPSLARGGRQMAKMRAGSDRQSGNRRQIGRCRVRMQQAESNAPLRSRQRACGKHLGALRDATPRWRILTACNGDAFDGTSAEERGRGL